MIRHEEILALEGAISDLVLMAHVGARYAANCIRVDQGIHTMEAIEANALQFWTGRMAAMAECLQDAFYMIASGPRGREEGGDGEKVVILEEIYPGGGKSA